MTMVSINGVKYPVTGYAEHENLGVFPVVDMPIMSNYNWKMNCLQDRLKNRELYAQFEDVDAAILRLQNWLNSHTREGENQ